jgi:hypothetical protein
MTQFLTNIIGIGNPLFKSGLQSLEKSTGNSGVDVRLVADVLESAHKVMRQLGLDTKDTTGHELYRALINSVKSGTAEKLLIDTDYTLVFKDGQVISFNLIDVINNSHHEMTFKNQVFRHGQRSLRGEIVTRYISHARTSKATTLETASLIGLLPEHDTWYNDFNHKHEHSEKDSKELVK